jgi:uncharacterized membrane protein
MVTLVFSLLALVLFLHLDSKHKFTGSLTTRIIASIFVFIFNGISLVLLLGWYLIHTYFSNSKESDSEEHC